MSDDRDRNFTHSAVASPPDVSLLLRAHSEQHWLSREVIPVIRQIETRECLPEEQLPAAIAYLEVIWAQAASRARVSDAALRQLDALAPPSEPLLARARRYHLAVKTLREATAGRVGRLIATPMAALGEKLLASPGCDGAQASVAAHQ
jgi:hypothetical protein